MDLPTIEMAKPQAKEAAAAYRAAVKERHDADDAALAVAYRELAKGSRLISLSQTILAGGTIELACPRPFRRYRSGHNCDPYDVTLPRLAVCRADRTHVWTNGIDEDGGLRMQGKQELPRNNTRDVVRIPDGTFEPGIRADSPWGNLPFNPVTAAVMAMAPIVPPPLRPAHHLRNYHVLFEAEWAFDPAPPPVDPALLKRIGGDLYAVLAVWDLTEVERAVLAGRQPA